MTPRSPHAPVPLLLLGFAIALSPHRAIASENVTLHALQRILAESQGKHDAQIAKQLSRLELTERLSSAEFKSLDQTTLGPGTRAALVALADASEFLPPAPADVLPQAPPDLNEQRRIIASTIDYLGKTLPRLPDFSATRATVRYAGGPSAAIQHDEGSWRAVGRSTAIVVYRDGKEVVNPSEWGKHSARHDAHHDVGALITRGTFGPILSTVIIDASHGDTTWDRWERGDSSPIAVFRYRVPQNQSHYSVGFHAPSSSKGEAEQYTGYHGELAIDPATGTILRITVQADLPFGSPLLESDIMVEYGPVEIGGKSYTCPLRSVAISFIGSGLADEMSLSTQYPDAVSLNDVTFSNYHLFRSDSRILTGDVPAPNP